MGENKLVANRSISIQRKNQAYWTKALPIYLMLLPGILYFVIFKYIPMFGVLISFQNYSPFKGVFGSEWVGLEHFVRLFSEQGFMILLKNTVALSLLDILIFFPLPILFALLLNEIRIKWFKITIQTIVYLPHFLSMVVVVAMTALFFSSQFGTINLMLESWGFEKIRLLTDANFFRWVWLGQNVWQSIGWSAIIFLATLASIDPSLYEAAVVDGAKRWRQTWHITLPALRQVIIILLILRISNFIEIGFEHVFLLQNPLNLHVSDIFDTYVYRQGILGGDFSYSTAVGLFKSLVGLIMVIGANKVAKKMGEEGVF